MQQNVEGGGGELGEDGVNKYGVNLCDHGSVAGQQQSDEDVEGPVAVQHQSHYDLEHEGKHRQDSPQYHEDGRATFLVESEAFHQEHRGDDHVWADERTRSAAEAKRQG